MTRIRFTVNLAARIASELQQDAAAGGGAGPGRVQRHHQRHGVTGSSCWGSPVFVPSGGEGYEPSAER
jgi:hypothetical protein